MTIFQILLFLISINTFFYIVRKLRKSQIQTEDTIFWIFTSLGLVLLSVFPQIAELASHIMGFQAPVNFIFCVMIFLLLMKIFSMSIKISQLEIKIKSLTEELAVREKLNYTFLNQKYHEEKQEK